MQIYTLPALERSQVWTQLTPKQKEVFNTYTMARVSSELLTRSFQMSSKWRLISVNIDYGWEMRKKTGNHHGYQYCECGRKLKYQFELESVINPKQHLLLGSTHFAEYAGIPLAIALEIQDHVNEIQIYMDEILYRYKRGERFPQDSYNFAIRHQLVDPTSHFGTKLADFQQSDLPLFHTDKNHLLSLNASFKQITATTHKNGNNMSVIKAGMPKPKTTLSDEEKTHIDLIKNHFDEQLEKYTSRTAKRGREERYKIKHVGGHILDLTNSDPNLAKSHDYDKQWLYVYNAFNTTRSINVRGKRGTHKKSPDFIALRVILRLEAKLWVPKLRKQDVLSKKQATTLIRRLLMMQATILGDNPEKTNTLQTLESITRRFPSDTDYFSPRISLPIIDLYSTISVQMVGTQDAIREPLDKLFRQLPSV
ncbi:hypothetical protein [Lacticaseibacillus jixiensis]|uniref:hypothetical protein n=1 Tax=Lacticaseibacillus jixiensis TaxID=3231926 RepID=UPI0036F1D267